MSHLRPGRDHNGVSGLPSQETSPGDRGSHWLIGFLLLAATLFPLFGCALKTGPSTGFGSGDQYREVLVSIPAEAEGLVPSHLTPPTLRGWSLLRDGRFSQAERQFIDALAAGSVVSTEGLAAAFSGLGFSRLGQSRNREAEDAFGQALAEQPGYSPARLGLALLLRFEGRFDESVTVYHQLSAGHPASAMLKLEATVVRLEAVQLLVRRGEAAEDRGDPQAAAAHFRQAADLDPEMPQLRGLLAGALKTGGHYDEAIEALGHALVLADGEEANAYRSRLAWLELEHGRPDRAVAWFSALLQTSPGDLALQDGLKRAEGKLREELLPPEYHRLLEGGLLTRGGLAAIIVLALGWDDFAGGTPGVRPRVIRDAGSHWAKPYIRAVVNREVMELYQNHTFRPEMPVTRGELAFAACRLLGQDEEGTTVGRTVVISDLSRDHRHFDCICRLVGLGLLERFPDNTVRINAEATGADALFLISSIHRLLADSQP